MTEHPDRIERTLELLLYAPVGVGLFLKEAAPGFVDRVVALGRAELDRRQEDVQKHVNTARSLGQLTMAFGPRVVSQKVERTVDDARRRAEGLFGTSPADEPATIEATMATTSAPVTPAPESPSPEPPPEPARPQSLHFAGAGRAPNGDTTGRAELPIPDYDALSASQVVERLVGLTAEELRAVHAYENSHRQRRTILGKIEQLAG